MTEYTGKWLIDRLAAKGPDLGDTAGMRSIAAEIMVADSAFLPLLERQYGRDAAAGLACGLTVALYLLREAQSEGSGNVGHADDS